MSNESFNNFLEFKKKYNELVLLIHKESGEEKLKTYIENVKDEDLLLLINNFCITIESDKKLKKLFLNRNERLFSLRTSVKIIPSFNLKSFLRKCNNESYIWECIQLIYAIYRTGDVNNKEFIAKVVSKIEECSYSGNKSIEVSNNNNNNNKSGQLDNMIMDIADTLRNNLVTDSKSNSKVNPIENMLKTSQMISQKYGNDLKKGKISMNDMFDSLGRMMGEIDKKTSNDQELKNIDVSDMPKPDDLMKNLGLDGGGKGIGNPMEMLSSLMGGQNNKKKEDLTPDQVKEMENFYANMSTSDIKKTDNVEENKDDGMNIASMLKSISGNSTSGNSTSDDSKASDNKNGLNDMLKELQGSDNNNMNNKLDSINKKLISQLPEDKQKEIESLTQNVLKMMGSK